MRPWLAHLGAFAGYAVRRVRERPSTLLLVPAALLLSRLGTRRLRRDDGDPGRVGYSIPSSGGVHGLTPGRVSVFLLAVDPVAAAQSLARLARQTHADTEIVVVVQALDDQAFAALVSRSQRVRMIATPGASPLEAVAAGSGLATGEYWTWLSSPVGLHPDDIERLAAALDAQPGRDLAWVEDGQPVATAVDPGTDVASSRCFLLRGSCGLALGATVATPLPRGTPLTVLAGSRSRWMQRRFFPTANASTSSAGPFDAAVTSSSHVPGAASGAAALVVAVPREDPWPGWIRALYRTVPRERIAVVVETVPAAAVASLFAPALVLAAAAPQTPPLLDTFVRGCVRRQAETHLDVDIPPWTAPHVLSRPLRILLQVEDFTRGGLESVVLQLGSALRSRNTLIALLVCGRAGDDVALARSYGWRVIVDAGKRERGPYDRLLKTFAPDVVHAHDAWFGADACAERQIPFVHTLHNCHVWLTDRVRAQARELDAATTVYACVSEQVARYAGLALHLDVGKMVLVPNGVSPAWERRHWDPVTRLAAREELGLPKDQLIYVCVASILPAKAQRALVKAFARVHASEPAARLLLVGGVINQAYWADVARTIESTGSTETVTHVPFTDRPDRYYAAADVFVLPSLWEGWSLALAEAVLMGLPVVTTRVGSAAAFEGYESVHVIDPPFDAIEALDPDAIRSYSWHDDSAFVERLANAMRSAALPSPARRRVPLLDVERLSSTRTHDMYVQMYWWLAQGGSARGLRQLAGDRATLA